MGGGGGGGGGGQRSRRPHLVDDVLVENDSDELIDYLLDHGALHQRIAER